MQEVWEVLQDWNAHSDIVAWARPYGTDLGRAWAECQRADHLVALAGAYAVVPLEIVRIATQAARAVLVHIPQRERPRSTRAVWLAEQWAHHGTEFPRGRMHKKKEVLAEIEAAEKVVERMEAEMERLVHVRKAMLPAARVESFATVHEVVHEAIIDAVKRGQQTFDHVAMLKVRDAFEAALETKSALYPMFQYSRDRYRALAAKHAASAALYVLKASINAQLAIESLVFAAKLHSPKGSSPARSSDVHRAAQISGRSTDRIYNDVGFSLASAAEAEGAAAASTDTAFAAAVRVALDVMVETIVHKEAFLGAMTETFNEIHRSHKQEVSMAKHIEFADAIRAAYGGPPAVEP